jgi:hypothetical protein
MGTATLINGTRFRGLMDDTLSLSQWLRYGVHFMEVDVGATSLQVQNFDNARWQHVPDAQDGDPGFDATRRPTYREVAFNPQHFVMELEVNLRAQRKARSWLNADLDRVSEEGFARGLGNNLARSVVLGDTTSADDSLNGFDGIYVHAQAQGRTLSLATNVGGVLVASAFDPDVLFWQAMRRMPDGLRSGRLRWYGHSDLWIQWARWLSNSGTDQRYRDGLAEQALTQGKAPGPMGYPLLSIPDWPHEEGPQAVPTAVADDGDGTMTVRVATVLPDANDYTGRRVRVRLVATGAFEDLTVVRVGGQNQALTAGSLGQAVISVVAADYLVEVIDETAVMLADPFGILLPVENEIQVYRDFDIRGLNKGLVAHAYCDQRLLRPDGVVLVTGIFLPSTT